MPEWAAAPPTPLFRPTPARRWLQRYVLAAAGLDMLAVVVAGLVGQVVVAPGLPASGRAWEWLVVVPAWLAAVSANRGYDHGALGVGSDEFKSLLRAGVALMAALAFVLYALDLGGFGKQLVVTLPAAVLLSGLSRGALRHLVRRRRFQGGCMRAVVAVGRESAVLDLVRQLRRERQWGMEVGAACVTDPGSADALRQEGVAVLGGLGDVAATVAALGADAVAVTSSSETAAAYLRRLSWELEGSGVELLVAPGLIEVAGPRMHVRPFIGLPLLQVEEPEFTGAKRIVKAAVDRSFAVAALLLAAPVLLAIAVAIRVDSPGPVLFRQTRIGQGGKEFTMLKFRTMVVDAEQRRAELLQQNQNADGLLFKIAADPRVTRVGRVLRRYSLDELPQLLNVLGGPMSLVGPRPPLPDEVALYDDSVRRRLLVKPGLTGLWQVSGRSDLTWDESVRLDLRYVENWSLVLDATILWKTAFAVLGAHGAY